MSDFVPELLRRIQATIRKRSDLSTGRTPISILPLRQSPFFERSPWEPRSIELTPDERRLLGWLWGELNQELGPANGVSESDVLCFALEQLQLKMSSENSNTISRTLGVRAIYMPGSNWCHEEGVSQVCPESFTLISKPPFFSNFRWCLRAGLFTGKLLALGLLEAQFRLGGITAD